MMRKRLFSTIKISENELRKQQVSGFYSDIDYKTTSSTDVNDELNKKERELEGTKKTGKQRNSLYFVRVSCKFRFRRF